MSANNGMLPVASGYVIKTMSDLTNYARILSHYRYITAEQREILLFFANELENTRNKWTRGSGRCLSGGDIDIILKFGDLLTRYSIDRYFTNNSIYNKLPRFWSHIRNIPDNVAAEVITGRSDSDQPSAPIDLPKIEAARLSSSLMINSVIDRNNSGSNNMPLLDIPAILLTIIIRSEAHEYALGKILQRAMNATNEPVDVTDLLSVTRREPKVKNGKTFFVTDM